MVRLGVVEVTVFILHALDRVLDGRVLARHATGAFAPRRDPVAQALFDGDAAHALAHLGRGTKTFDRNDLLHGLRKDAGIKETDGSAQRMRDDRDRYHLFLVHELGDVVDVVDFVVARAGRPIAIAVTA